MNMMKKLFVQSMVISTSILFLNGINFVFQHFTGNDISLAWYQPITIILTGVLCSLPSILLENMDQWNRKKVWFMVVLHCLTLYAVVIGASFLFHWYSGLDGYVGVSVIFFTIYAFVWLTNRWLDKKDEKKINKALDAIRDKE